MLNRLMCIFFLALLLDKVSLSYIFVSESETTMSNAFLRCRERNGTLLTNDEVYLYADQIKDQCPEIKGVYWIGNYSTMTPMLSLEGCFEYKNFSAAFFIIPENSVAKCQARCNTEDGITVKGDTCQCLILSDLNDFTNVGVGQCDIQTNAELKGGSNNKMSVYLRQGNNDGDEVTPSCVYGQCMGRRTLKEYCDSQDKRRTVCGGAMTSYGESDVWWEAMETCISNNSYLISTEEWNEIRDKICETEGTLVWTNERQYIDTITIPGDGLQEGYIHHQNIVCQRVNISDLTIIDTRQCNSNENYKFLCRIEVWSNESASCVVDLTTEQIDQTSQSTMRSLVLSTDISDASSSPMVTNTTVLSEHEDRTVQEPPPDSTQVVLIGSAAGGGVVCLLIIGLIFFVVKRRSKKSTDGSVKFSELKKAEENGTQSLKGVDNQLFMTPGQANTVGERYEAAYDLAGDGEPKFDKSDTEYDLLRQNKKPGDDSTYDHTTNTYGMTSHVTNDAAVYDSGDPSIYDRSRSNKKSMRGDDVYDKMESNIYDKTNTNGSDKSGDNIYDRGNDHVYDGTSVAKRSEIGDNIYDKTNDNVYDGTSVAKRCETGDNIYDKTNENLYDKSSTSRSDQAGDNVYDKTNENIYD